MEIFWSALDREEGRASATADPLGLDRAENAIAELLVPGFSAATSRPRNLSLLLGAVCLMDGEPPKGRRDNRRLHFERFERLCVHAIAAQGSEARNLQVSGIKKAIALGYGRDPRRHIDLDEKLVQSGGGWLWQYRGLARTLGLLEPGDDLKEPGRPTELGRELGRLALLRIPNKQTCDDVVDAIQKGKAPLDLVKSLRTDRLPSDEELRIIGTCLTTHSNAYERLAAKDRRRRTSTQRTLTQAARGLEEVVAGVEEWFRARVGIGSTETIANHIPLAERLREAISVAGVADDPWLIGLESLLLTNPNLTALTQHHHLLMAARGTAVWDGGEPPSPSASDIASDEELNDASGDDVGNQLIKRGPARARLRALCRMLTEAQPSKEWTDVL